MTQASAGIAASLATAVITPRATTTVASSMGGPETGTTFTPRIAKYCGSPPCALAEEALARIIAAMNAADSTEKPMRLNKERMSNSFWKNNEETADRPSAVRTDEATEKFPASQAEHSRWRKKSACCGCTILTEFSFCRTIRQVA